MSTRVVGMGQQVKVAFNLGGAGHLIGGAALGAGVGGIHAAMTDGNYARDMGAGALAGTAAAGVGARMARGGGAAAPMAAKPAVASGWRGGAGARLQPAYDISSATGRLNVLRNGSNSDVLRMVGKDPSQFAHSPAGVTSRATPQGMTGGPTGGEATLRESMQSGLTPPQRYAARFSKTGNQQMGYAVPPAKMSPAPSPTGPASMTMNKAPGAAGMPSMPTAGAMSPAKMAAALEFFLGR